MRPLTSIHAPFLMENTDSSSCNRVERTSCKNLQSRHHGLCLRGVARLCHFVFLATGALHRFRSVQPGEPTVGLVGVNRPPTEHQTEPQLVFAGLPVGAVPSNDSATVQTRVAVPLHLLALAVSAAGSPVNSTFRFCIRAGLHCFLWAAGSGRLRKLSVGSGAAKPIGAERCRPRTVDDNARWSRGFETLSVWPIWRSASQSVSRPST